jgi:glycosyltransferase involved in cell wall biosynthesis
VILYLGRLNKEKGLLDLVSAFNKVNAVNDQSLLLLVGYDEENISKHVIETLKVDTYKIIGPTNNPVLFYQASDIFCLPSYREGFGTSIIEASSVGLPILCSDTYGLKDTIIDYVTGIRHEVGNIEDIYTKLTYLVRNSDFRIELGNNGRKYILDNFLSEIVTMAWKDFYKELSES